MDLIAEAQREVNEARAALNAARERLPERQQQFFGPMYIEGLTETDYQYFLDNGPGNSGLENDAFREAKRYREAVKRLAQLEAAQRQQDAEDWVWDQTRPRRSM